MSEANVGAIVIEDAKTGDISQVWNILQKHQEHDDTIVGTVSISPLNYDLIRKSIGSWKDASKYFEVLVARNAQTGEIVATSLYQKRFSIHSGRIIWMDQLFVLERVRGGKIGKKMVHKLLDLAIKEEASLMWNCLETNSDSIKFYHSLGASIISESTLREGDINVKVLGFELKDQDMKI